MEQWKKVWSDESQFLVEAGCVHARMYYEKKTSGGSLMFWTVFCWETSGPVYFDMYHLSNHCWSPSTPLFMVVTRLPNSSKLTLILSLWDMLYKLIHGGGGDLTISCLSLGARYHSTPPQLLWRPRIDRWELFWWKKVDLLDIRQVSFNVMADKCK